MQENLMTLNMFSLINKIIKHKMKRIQGNKHKIGTWIDKISLWCFDHKRYALDDGIYTSAYFHKDSHKL